MLGTTDINAQGLNIQPYVFVDTSGATIYTGVSLSFPNGGASVWRIKKEWKVGNVTYMGFPDGDQGFTFIWNNRTGYTYR
jgi:hypothetical protein